MDAGNPNSGPHDADQSINLAAEHLFGPFPAFSLSFLIAVSVAIFFSLLNFTFKSSVALLPSLTQN